MGSAKHFQNSLFEINYHQDLMVNLVIRIKHQVWGKDIYIVAIDVLCFGHVPCIGYTTCIPDIETLNLVSTEVVARHYAKPGMSMRNYNGCIFV